MELTELERVVRLHKKAYDILLWLKQEARRTPDLLSEDAIRPLELGETGVIWLKRHLNDLPLDIRPRPDEIRPAGFLLSSFFQTSFRVDNSMTWDGHSETTLLRGAKQIHDARHKRHTERREARAVDELKRLAIVALAEENGVTITPESVEQSVSNPKTASDLTLWSYGCELVRRSEFASQGTPVHRLWLELNEKTRKRFSAELIWKARERLEQWLQDQNTKEEVQ